MTAQGELVAAVAYVPAGEHQPLKPRFLLQTVCLHELQ